MNKSAKEIAEEIISGTRLIDREVVHLAYELAKAVVSEAASSEPVAWRMRFTDVDGVMTVWQRPRNSPPPLHYNKSEFEYQPLYLKGKE